MYFDISYHIIQEKKERHKLETLNQMLQENMHVCLTKVASRGDCSEYVTIIIW